jgi:hypothetical protein
VQNADGATLFEGLPHQFEERKLLESEKAQKETVTLHGHLFYREPQQLSTVDEETLRVVLSDEGSFREWRETKCGAAYHPDYAVEWSVNGTPYRFLICFGCGEAKVYGPDYALHCSIKSEIYRQVREILTKYQKNRPPRRSP